MHDAFLDSRSKMTSYREFIGTFRELGLKSMTLREIAKAGSFDGMLGLRHDVDHHIERAYLMGRIEADAGAHATYFLLPPGDYDKDENYYGRIVSGAVEHNPEMLALALELTGMGHEIALHNDFLQLSIRTGRPIAELISAEIDWFAKNGIQITGSASHGSTFAARNKISNYEIFAECVRAQNSGRSIPAGKKQFPLNSISMKQLGLEYEAYFIGKSFYISDSGGAVTWPRLNESGTEETFHMEQVDCQAIAGDFKRSPHKGVQALFHADHWQFSDAQAGNEPSLDRLHTARRMARAQGWRSPRARPATLPLGYLESLLSGLSENPRIRLHHFGNVEIDPPCEGEDPRARCAREYTAWAESLTEGRRDASQIHIFVQLSQLQNRDCALIFRPERE